MTRDDQIIAAAEHIRRTIPASDMGGRMVMAAFLMDEIDYRHNTGSYGATPDSAQDASET